MELHGVCSMTNKTSNLVSKNRGAEKARRITHPNLSPFECHKFQLERFSNIFKIPHKTNGTQMA